MTVETLIGKITASKDTLNSIAAFLIDAEMYNQEHMYRRCEESAKKVKTSIHDALEACGFYEGV